MGLPSEPASNAIIYTTYAACLVGGLAIGWKFRNSKSDYLASLRTQTALPLALNFAASGLGSGIFLTYPGIGTVAGIQGVLTYAFASALPIMTFPYLGAKIRRHCPHGFVFTEFVRERFGIVASLLLSVFSCLTMFLYMAAELTAVSTVINLLTGLNGLPATIVEVVVTLMYTAVGGFRTSLITDNIQGALICVLLIICSCAMGAYVHIDRSLIEPSNLTHASLLGWQLLYILPIAIVFNNYFLSSFWQRAFASKTDRDLWQGCLGATVIIFVILTLVGFTGVLAAWGGLFPIEEYATTGYNSFFLLLGLMPSWVVGFCLLFAIIMSCSVYDTLQCALVATISNDVFRNKINIWWVRLILLVNIPAVVVATKNANILVLFLIADLVSACLLPPILLGLVPSLYFLSGFDIVIGGLGGFLTVFLFGTIYYGNASDGAGVLILQAGLYADDWSAFGAFVAAPVGSLLWTFGAFAIRYAVIKAYCQIYAKPFTIMKKKHFNKDAYADEAVQRGILLPEERDMEAVQVANSGSASKLQDAEGSKLTTEE